MIFKVKYVNNIISLLFKFIYINLKFLLVFLCFHTLVFRTASYVLYVFLISSLITVWIWSLISIFVLEDFQTCPQHWDIPASSMFYSVYKLIIRLSVSLSCSFRKRRRMKMKKINKQQQKKSWRQRRSDRSKYHQS